MSITKVVAWFCTLAALLCAPPTYATPALTLLGESWTAGGTASASEGSGSFHGDSYSGSVVSLVAAGANCTSVWTFWCWGDSSSEVTQRAWVLDFGLAPGNVGATRLSMDWNLSHMIGLYALALGYTGVGAYINYGWRTYDASQGSWSASTSFAQSDSMAVDTLDSYVGTHVLSGGSNLGLLADGDILELSGSFTDEAAAQLVMLGTLSATSFSMFDFNVTATTEVPEPGVLLLVALGLAALQLGRRTAK